MTDKFFALFFVAVFVLLFSSSFFFFMWREMDPNLKPQTLVESFDYVCRLIPNSILVKSVFTWRHGGHIGVPKQWNGGHVGVPRQPCGNWTLFLWKYFRLFVVSIDAGYVSKYALYVALNNVVTCHLSTCTAERSFRSMKRLKTPLLRSIREDRLSCLEILHIHKREDVNWPLQKYHNIYTIMLFVCHPKNLNKLSFSWGHFNSEEKFEDNAYAKFWRDKQRALWYVMIFSGVVNWYWWRCTAFAPSEGHTSRPLLVTLLITSLLPFLP